MTRIIHTAFVLMSLLGCSVSAEEEQFQAFCTYLAAQDAASSKANEKFGFITDLSDDEYDARSKWVNAKYAEAEKDFKAKYEWRLEEVENKAYANGWPSKCNLDGQ